MIRDTLLPSMTATLKDELEQSVWSMSDIELSKIVFTLRAYLQYVLPRLE